MLKFEVPQDGVFFALVNDALSFGENILTNERIKEALPLFYKIIKINLCLVFSQNGIKKPGGF